MDVKHLLELLKLSPLPGEGGYYRRTFSSAHPVHGGNIAGSAIYYLITAASGSALHRLKESDEMFHYYCGDPVEMLLWDESSSQIHYPALGNRLELGELPQLLVPAGCWQAMRLRNGGKWALLGTTVTPGYQSQDFELAAPGQSPHTPDSLRKELSSWMANA